MDSRPETAVASPSQSKPGLQKPPGYREPAAPVGQPSPQKPGLPPSLRPKSKRRRYCRCCCCACCILFLVLLFATVIAAGLVYVIYDPQLPVFHLQSFRFPKLNVTEKADGSYLDAMTVTSVEVRNRNQMMVWYFEQSSFEVSADGGNLNLGFTRLPGFALAENDASELRAETRVKGQALGDEQGKRLKSRVENEELVPSVEVETRTGFGVQGWKSWTLGINVVCGDVAMKRLEGGEMPVCTITILKWIKIR